MTEKPKPAYVRRQVTHYWPKTKLNVSYCGTDKRRPYTDKLSEATCRNCLKAYEAKVGVRL